MKSIPSANSRNKQSNPGSSQDGATVRVHGRDNVLYQVDARVGCPSRSSVPLCLLAQLSQASQNRDLGIGPNRAHWQAGVADGMKS